MHENSADSRYDKNLNFVTRLPILEKIINHRLFFEKQDLRPVFGSRVKRILIFKTHNSP